ncbi:MAG: copper-binding protein [Burkholderiales bacterium]|nr:copper-binding protein [Burkholderiales bacterium]
MKIIANFAWAIALGIAVLTFAYADDKHHASAASSEASTALNDGEIKKVDKAAGKLTIKHGRLANLDMPGMTMNFHVKDSAFLGKVKAGDRIGFVAEKINGQYVVTRLEVKN